MHAAVATLLLAGALSVAGSSDASPYDSSESLIKKGNELRRTGDDARALPEYQKAYNLLVSGRTAAQLGLCEYALGRFADAETHLLEALNGHKDAWVTRNRATLEDSLAKVKAHVGRVEVVGEPDGATILVNGREVGKLPLAATVPVNAGPVQVEGVASGYERAERSASVTAGQVVTFVLRLRQHSQSRAPEPSPQASLLTRGVVRPAAEEGSPAFYRRAWFWTVAAAAVAAVAVGVFIAGRRTNPTMPDGRGQF
jgi:hypothetical protein